MSVILSIKSRKLGRTFNFSRPGNSYLYVDTNGQEECLGCQICDGGWYTGSTLTATDDEQAVYVCRRWYNAHLRNIRKNEIRYAY